MTKKLEELLDLPEVKETMEQVETPEPSKEVKKETVNLERSIAEFDKISAALPMVKGLGELADKELDDLADKAKQSYEDLMDLGMNVESRYAGRVFETASNTSEIKVENVIGSFSTVDFLSGSQSGPLLARPNSAPIVGTLVQPSDIGLTYSLTNKSHTVFDVWGYFRRKSRNQSLMLRGCVSFASVFGCCQQKNHLFRKH